MLPLKKEFQIETRVEKEAPAEDTEEWAEREKESRHGAVVRGARRETRRKGGCISFPAPNTRKGQGDGAQRGPWDEAPLLSLVSLGTVVSLEK